MLSYGDYAGGSGLSDDPMLFRGGSDVSCKQVGKEDFEHIHILLSLIFLTEKKQPGVL